MNHVASQCSISTTFTLGNAHVLVSTLRWGRSHTDSIECSGCSYWAFREPLHNAREEAPRKCVSPQRLMTEGPCRMSCCINMMLQAVLSGVVSEDALGACVAQKVNRDSNGGSSCLCRTEMTSCQQMQVQGYFRDHKGVTLNEIQPCEFIE